MFQGPDEAQFALECKTLHGADRKRLKAEGCEGIRPPDLNYCASVALIDFAFGPCWFLSNLETETNM